MSRLHIYIDGTWLYKVFEGDVFKRFICDVRYFEIDFERFNLLLLKHIQNQRPECKEIGKCHFVTSLFDLPDDFEQWEKKQIAHPNGTQTVVVSKKNIEVTKWNVKKRKKFADAAIRAGYDKDCIFHVQMQEWMLLSLLHPELRYQEKQVDTTVVALLVRDAIEHPDDCFALVAGDADILPAIQIAYPNYTRNVFPVLTSPDEREGKNRQTSFKYSQYNFDIDTLVLQNHIGDIMAGNVYKCTECHRYFTTRQAINRDKIRSGQIQSRCPDCRRK